MPQSKSMPPVPPPGSPKPGPKESAGLAQPAEGVEGPSYALGKPMGAVQVFNFNAKPDDALFG
jgi:hypothetical protein